MKILFAIILFAIAATHSGAETSVPRIAQLCGVRVGCDTMETLERQFGRGLPQVGGHAHGARLWQSSAAKYEIYADAFHYNDRSGDAHGRVLDFISITPLSSHDPKLPDAKLPRKQALFMDVVSIGMTKAEVLRALKSKLPPPKALDFSLVWESPGLVRLNRLNDVVTKLWRAELQFKVGKLHEIRITSDTGYDPY